MRDPREGEIERKSCDGYGTSKGAPSGFACFKVERRERRDDADAAAICVVDPAGGPR